MLAGTSVDDYARLERGTSAARRRPCSTRSPPVCSSTRPNAPPTYRANGCWRDYLHGERVHIVLSLVAKSVLAWQIFANVLVTSNP
jgi:hypothetical protein